MLCRRSVSVVLLLVVGLKEAASGGLLRGGGVRVQHASRRDIPGRGSPVWGGRSFDDSPFAINPWDTLTQRRPNPIVENLEPEAPFERSVASSVNSIVGAVPQGPGPRLKQGYHQPRLPDVITPYRHPSTFPAERPVQDFLPKDSPLIPIGERDILATGDKLRPPFWSFRPEQSEYPLMAPANRVADGLYPTAVADRVPEEFARYLEQMSQKRADVRIASRVDKLFHSALVNNQQDPASHMLSRDQFFALMKNPQNKTIVEAQKLWDSFVPRGVEVMSRDEFRELATHGFDPGPLDRSDILSVLRPASPVGLGYWGSGALCPPGSGLVAVQIKVMPTTNNAQDNTGLNCMRFRCEDGTEVASVEGPDGSWTDWATCPEGQAIYGFRLREQVVQPGQDNAGINDMEFDCRSRDLSKTSVLRFGLEQTKVANEFDKCWDQCSGKGGFCSFCGRGNACCRRGYASDPAECQGITQLASTEHHQCVAPANLAKNAGQPCWKKCDWIGGYCNYCGAGGMCCRKNWLSDSSECKDAAALAISTDHTCVSSPTVQGIPSSEDTVVAAGVPGIVGGWAARTTCANNAVLCGTQARLGDGLGITDMRLYCCKAPIDCSAVCSTSAAPQGQKPPSSSACAVCKQAAAAAESA